jgi:hypothetical protein
MGKRSNFERIPRDFYPTPYAAVPPLIPFLRGVRTFAEPCCGDGALVRHLGSFGLRCVYAGDIADGQDALALDTYGDADVIITNPPYTRELMHRLIAHFQRIAPTWLLIDYDWSATKQATPFMPHCSDIVILPRLKWFEDSKDTGKDNHAWYRFDVCHSAGPIFHSRDSAPVPSRVSLCAQCGAPYRPQRSDSRFCSDVCRQRAHRARLAVTKRDVPGAPTEAFRYVRHAEVPRFTAEGWELLPALDGTHHGEYSVLMRRVEQGERAMSKTAKPKMPEPSPPPEAPGADTEFRGRDESGIDKVFRYVGQEDVAQLVAEGWTATPAIPGSRDFAFLMQRPAPQTDSPEDQTA